MSGNPVPDCLDFLILGFVGLNRRRRAIEYGDRVAPVIGSAIDVGDDGAEQPVGLCAYLVRRPVVHAQGVRTAPAWSLMRFFGSCSRTADFADSRLA
jgi:hypothetical protein